MISSDSWEVGLERAGDAHSGRALDGRGARPRAVVVAPNYADNVKFADTRFALLLMLLTCVGLYVIFKRRGWL